MGVFDDDIGMAFGKCFIVVFAALVCRSGVAPSKFSQNIGIYRHGSDTKCSVFDDVGGSFGSSYFGSSAFWDAKELFCRMKIKKVYKIRFVWRSAFYVIEFLFVLGEKTDGSVGLGKDDSLV